MSIFNNDLNLTTIYKINKRRYLINRYKWHELQQIKKTLMKGTFKNNDLFKYVNHYLTRLSVIQNKCSVKEEYYFDYYHNFNNRVLNKIRDYVYQLLQVNGFNIANTGTITLLSYRPTKRHINNKKSYFTSKFDNKFTTCVLYLRKNKDLMVGNINYVDINNNKKCIKLNENNVLCFNGSLKHHFKSIGGNSLMNVVIFKFVTNRRLK